MSTLNDLSRWLVGGTPAFAERSVRCASPVGLHRMRYVEWGEPDNPNVLLCAHGTTRNGRDFDELARALAPEFRVICPDLVGRGRSDWLSDVAEYDLRQHVADMMVLLGRLDVDSVNWLGTALGGLIGLWIAGQTESPIARLLLNDVAPKVGVEPLLSAGGYVTDRPTFETYEDAEAHLRLAGAGFGTLTSRQWHHLATYGVRSDEDGRFVLHYDPAIGQLAKRADVSGSLDLWSLYDCIRCPTFVIRGADSPVLTSRSIREMAERGPMPQWAEIAGVGHAPMFQDTAQIHMVRDFLRSE